MQIYAKLLSPNFHSGKSYVKKVSVYFVAIRANSPCKIETFELEVVGGGILGKGFCSQGSYYISYRKITARRVTAISFLSLISCFSLVSNNILAEKFKLGILDTCACKNAFAFFIKVWF